MAHISPLINRTSFRERLLKTQKHWICLYFKMYISLFVFCPSHCHFKAIFEMGDIFCVLSGEISEEDASHGLF